MVLVLVSILATVRKFGVRLEFNLPPKPSVAPDGALRSWRSAADPLGRSSGIDDRDLAEVAEVEQVAVAGYDQIGIGGDGGGEHLIVVGIARDGGFMHCRRH